MRVHLERLAGLSDCLVVSASPIQRTRQIGVDDEGRRIEFPRPFVLIDRLVVTACRH